ncbi:MULTISPECIES: pseudouridine synthase [Rhizobiaceae]|jgi:23S rRNA pseudouridine2605 synthase|uniref:Pseudouridine synthase n=1 Tax=Aliirhizobium cellulosilyticum TaxID=393664 RepID=A0A7W6UZW7_9HYPH|nr:pseudouridine synthase [Rhizobium cellulosilyticum]MBB4348594.1 23S rRNA pseudouridine2605 synthase [Rhizobium cellulosilyticum]MBB4411830.1 23S rRNA pseudouridine2605 synthase [Rhizobium cellulosilyticum]MBB4446521.1 23S rRNA pseudouridine2605 synthase [Rhizobium cellulosilyticum]
MNEKPRRSKPTQNRRPPAAPVRKPAAPSSGKRVTLPRALSKLGFCSRTQAEDLIRAGQVSVNGRTVTDTEAWIDLDTAKLAVDGREVAAEAPVYLMLNKPRGLVTTRHDPEGRPTVFDCLKGHDHTHLSPVGRLDKASEGLLLFTNDTQFANALLDPETHVPKTYHVQIDTLVDDEMLKVMTKGIEKDGETLKARRAIKLREGEKNSWLEIELDEGKNRHIRRMLEVLDIGTLRLIRVAIGDLVLGDLDKGAVRALSEAELDGLRVQSAAAPKR